MKKLSLKIVVIIAIVLMMTALLGCKGIVKLLETVNINDAIFMFEYDNQNRIIKAIINDRLSEEVTVSLTLSYNKDKLISIVSDPDDDENHQFSINGNEIRFQSTKQTEELKVNEAGYLVFRKIRDVDSDWESTYQYKEGNLASQSYTFKYDWSESTYRNNVTYSYDGMNSPVNCNTPKWFLQHLISADFTGKNNPVSLEYTSIYEDEDAGEMSSHYIYEYDSDGFPIKRFSEELYTIFTYRSE